MWEVARRKCSSVQELNLEFTVHPDRPYCPPPPFPTVYPTEDLLISKHVEPQSSNTGNKSIVGNPPTINELTRVPGTATRCRLPHPVLSQPPVPLDCKRRFRGQGRLRNLPRLHRRGGATPVRVKADLLTAGQLLARFHCNIR